MEPLRRGHQPAPVPHLLNGRYEILGEIGRGGCAIVFEARDRHLDRLVAIKILTQRGPSGAPAERFAREARVAAAIHHPNVCSVIDVGYLQDGRPFIVMERLWGESLRKCLARVGSLDANVMVDVAIQMLSGLEAVHGIGIVHRDIKPDNVYLVQRNGCMPLVKLLDFGMCRAATLNEPVVLDDRTLTFAGTVVGTPEYMAPEQVSGTRVFSPQIDIYAVGIVLYEALTGTRAFAASDVRSVLVSVLVKTLPPLRSIRPDLPTVLDRIIARAIEKNPRARYQSARELQEDLLVAKARIEESRARESGPVLRDTDWELPTRRMVAPRRAAAG
jgi:serine/threonine-protein kinase